MRTRTQSEKESFSKQNKKTDGLQFFKDFKGALGVDGYGVYDLLDKLDGIMILCCWAHCRRYFDRALNHDRKRAEHGIEQIGLIYRDCRLILLV